MANQFATNPFSLTAAMGSSYRNTVPAGQQSNTLIIRKVDWVGGTAAQTAVIQDGHGNALVTITAPTGTDASMDVNINCADFQVTTLASGTLYMYMR